MQKPANSPQPQLPRTVKVWHQTQQDRRIPFYGSNRWTLPGRSYVVGRMEQGGRIYAFAGPFRSDSELRNALRSVEVQPADDWVVRNRGDAEVKAAATKRLERPNAQVQPHAAMRRTRGCSNVRLAACRLQRYVRHGGHLGEAELNPDGSFHSLSIGNGEFAHLLDQALLTRGGELVSHRFPLLAVQEHGCLTWIEPTDVAGERDNLDPVQVLIGCVIADDHGGTLLPYLTAHRWVEVHPPDFTAFHRSCQR
jgi:hypothetical protein